jgi:excisionase family DNA binding protein
MNESSSPLWTVKEVAKYLNLHEISIYRMIKRGEIPAFRIGGCWRFTKERIDEWLRNSERGKES